MHQRGVKRVSATTISVLTEENTSNDRILTCLFEIVHYFYTRETSINKIEDKFNLGLWAEVAL